MESNNAKSVDWNLLKFQYEVLGFTIDQLAKENPSTTAGLIQDAAKEQRWEAGSIDTLVPVIQNEDNNKNSLEQFTEAAKAQLIGSNLMKQKHLFPEFAKCEAILLSKISQAAISLDMNDEKAYTKISNLVKSLQGLLAHNQFLTTTIDPESTAGGSGFSVTINQQIN